MRAFRGAHLTGWNYFQHLKASGTHDPYVWFSDDSIRTAENPWLAEPERVVRSWRLEDYDALVVGGRDWAFLTPAQRADPPIPVLHLIPHVKRVDPADETFAYLLHRGIRICITQEIAARLTATGAANGPVYVNTHGFDAAAFPPLRDYADRETDVLVVGLKKPELATRLGRRLAKSPALAGRRVEVVTQRVPRREFLGKLANARVAVLLPNPTEGFYRPALETMAVRTLVVCPEFQGNAETCTPGLNCLMPPYTEDALVEAVENAHRLPAARREAIVEAAQRVARARTIEDERRGFLEILETEARAGRWPRSA